MRSHGQPNKNQKAPTLLTHAGCNVTTPAPQLGDVRLMPLLGTATATAPCDAVHLGGVEIFNRGLWGRITVHNNDMLTAQVVCRQLGFPFWTLYATGTGDPTPAPPGQRFRVWARSVTCTGREARLDECVFPAPGLSADTANPPEDFDRRDTGHFGVVCRQFEMAESDFVRR
eukprot:jgi/Ulvmu1/1299/UM011_0025.1